MKASDDDLTKPMAPIFYSALGKPTREDAMKERAAIRGSRMKQLMRDFGIASTRRDKWEALAYRLAEQYVPGLQVSDPNVRSGAEKVWDNARASLLHFEMTRRVDAGLNIKKAAAEVAKQMPWTQLLKGDDGRAEALRRQFTRNRKRPEVQVGAQIIGLAFEFHSRAGTWDQYVRGWTTSTPIPYV